jgi:hypothetical protein
MRLGLGMSDEAQRRDLSEGAGYWSAPTNPANVTTGTPLHFPSFRQRSEGSLRPSPGYWAATWRDGDEARSHNFS